VDLADFAAFQRCFDGPGVAHPGVIGDIDCANPHVERGLDDPLEGHVDLADAAVLIGCHHGPDATVPLGCY
jgi:hypothetical protein